MKLLRKHFIMVNSKVEKKQIKLKYFFHSLHDEGRWKQMIVKMKASLPDSYDAACFPCLHFVPVITVVCPFTIRIITNVGS